MRRPLRNTICVIERVRCRTEIACAPVISECLPLVGDNSLSIDDLPPLGPNVVSKSEVVLRQSCRGVI